MAAQPPFSGRHAVMVTDAASAARASEQFPFHEKVLSWLLLWRIELPTLKGIVLPSWSTEAESLIHDFIRATGANALLVRSDSFPERGDYLPGGDIAALDQLEAACAKYFRLGRLVFLLEPRSRFDDLYSLGIGFHALDRMIVEIVGPGFDASDLKRGDASPHERLDIGLGAGGKTERLAYEVTSTENYRRSWMERLTKVGQLIEGRYPAEGELNAAPPSEIETWLRVRGDTLLLEYRDQYLPIPQHLLDPVLSQCQGLPQRLAELGRKATSFVVSLSLVGRFGEPVYWDIVWPSRKFQIGSREQAAHA